MLDSISDAKGIPAANLDVHCENDTFRLLTLLRLILTSADSEVDSCVSAER